VRSKHILNWQAVINDGILEHVDVKSDIKSAGSHWRQLAEHDVLCNAMTVIFLTNSRSFHQNFHRLLERATHEGTSVSTVNTMPSDSHERPMVCHEVAQQGEVTIVDIRTVEFDDTT
jgi:hypothetical protein